jgi:HEAT repeat protein
MAWPLSQDYNEAIQSPRSNFADEELRHADPVLNALGIPIPCSGNFADVYQMHSPRGRWAVKCFTREVQGLRERYAAISRCLSAARLPFTVDFSFLEQGIRIRGEWYPVLKMQWVEGVTLNAFVREYADKPAMMKTLLQVWVRMAARLRAAGIAHGDLQHGNILLVPGPTSSQLAFKLVDYDGLFVPELAGGHSGEVGHACYQHPQRIAGRIYSAEVDRFPLLLVATALDGLRVGGRALWEKYDNGDNLLFHEADLRAPVKSLLFYQLLKLPDERASRLARLTVDALKGRLESVPLLEELLPELLPTAAPRTMVVQPIALHNLPRAIVAEPVATAEAPTSAWGAENQDHLQDPPRSSRRLLWLLGTTAAVAVLVLFAGLTLAFRALIARPTNNAPIAQNNTDPMRQTSSNEQDRSEKSQVKPTRARPRMESPRDDLPLVHNKPKSEEPSDPPRTSDIVANNPTKTDSTNEEGFVPLFNGKNLDGWQLPAKQPESWRVENGLLIGSGVAPNNLYTERGDYTSFHLRVEVRCSVAGSASVDFRCLPRGYAFQVLAGSLWGFDGEGATLLADAQGKPHRAGEWCVVEVIASGTHVTIKENGKTKVDFTDDKRRPVSGHIGLNLGSVDMVAELRRIEIKELLVGDLPADATVADLRRALKSEDHTVREAAAARLAKLGPSAESAVADLADTLSDEKNTERTRQSAAQALAALGPAARKVVPALVGALRPTQPLEIRRYAAEALAKMAYPANAEAIPAVLDAIKNDHDPVVRQKCVWALFDLHEIQKKGIDTLLAKILDETSPEMKLAQYDAARKLASELHDAAPDKTVDVLLDMLQNKSVRLYKTTDSQPDLRVDARYMAADALGWLGRKARRRKDVVDALKAATTDTDPHLRKSATAALKSLGVP